MDRAVKTNKMKKIGIDSQWNTRMLFSRERLTNVFKEKVNKIRKKSPYFNTNALEVVYVSTMVVWQGSSATVLCYLSKL